MKPPRYALVGSPIERSPSPAMYDAAFAALGMSARYELRPAGRDDAEAVLEELARGMWAGVNVTTPLKTVLAAKLPLVGEAARAGAVNTVWRGEAGLASALTDVDGVREPLRALHVGRAAALDQPAREALVLGSGGAARAAVVALTSLGLEVHLGARDTRAARAILEVLAPSGSSVALEHTRALADLMSRAEVVVQATPVGRGGEELPLPWEAARPGAVAFEMLYLPRRTPFVRAAQAAGLRVVEGWEMLVAQGARSFELWTGASAPREVMRQATLAALPAG